LITRLSSIRSTYARTVCNIQPIQISRSVSHIKKLSNGQIEISFQKPYLLHLLDEKSGPAMSSVTNREELLDFFKQMVLIRRAEIACDTAYKEKLIRGFLHLYNGQEAVAVGIDSALTREDHTITAYRCHGFYLTKRCGGDVKALLAELFGKKTGCSKGKGGSMHLYNVPGNFWGGNGIVGAQVPLGTGVAFAMKYLKKPNVCVTAFGDGAANQGQVYESFNMAYLDKYPCIYLVENNMYAMGTPVERASATKFFYTRGDYIPGIQFDGMNVLMAREVGKFAKKYAVVNGPILLEALTYRYKGHSMSDPEVTYRTKGDVDNVRKTRDPITLVHDWLTGSGLATADELTEIEQAIKKTVDEALQFAKESEKPSREDLYTDVYVKQTPVRGVELSNP
jgi:pyruvate dehydrogenase E1 component alpha subunit